MHALSKLVAVILQNKVDAMVKHLASLASDRLIISFAPKTVAYSVLKRIGELFPGPSKVTTYICASSTYLRACKSVALSQRRCSVAMTGCFLVVCLP